MFSGKFKYEPGCDGLGYGAFALRDTEHDGEHHGTLYLFRDEWKLSFEYPEVKRRDVEAALWGWTHFGGLGGRTRRGFGAIFQNRGPEIPDIDAGWATFVSGEQVDWPCLAKNRAEYLRIGGGKDTGEKVLNSLLKKYREFRQDPIGRKPKEYGENHPGRSYWPEPDAIRSITGQGCPTHRERVTAGHVFPRASFGMPIIFHFKDKGDPTDATLKPTQYGRLASRLILRPHAEKSPSECRPMALVLTQPDVGGVVLEWGKAPNSRSEVVQTRLNEEEARRLGLHNRPSPLAKDGKVYTDPIKRFLEEIS